MVKHNRAYIESVRQDVRRLQYWFEGFEAAGGKLPQCINIKNMSVLNSMDRILHEYLEIIHNEATNSRED